MSVSAAGSVPFWIAGAAVAGTAAVGAVWYSTQSNNSVDVTPAAPEVVIEAAVAPTSEKPDVTPEPAAPETTAEAEPDPVAPRLDEVRVEGGGVAVIAGRAAPFANVILRADGSEVARAAADGNGAFATVTFLTPSDDPLVLSVAEIDAAGVESDLRDEVILAPIAQPIVSAATEVTPEPQPQPEAPGEIAKPVEPEPETPANDTVVAESPAQPVEAPAAPTSSEVVAALAPVLEEPKLKAVTPQDTAPTLESTPAAALDLAVAPKDDSAPDRATASAIEAPGQTDGPADTAAIETPVANLGPSLQTSVTGLDTGALQESDKVAALGLTQDAQTARAPAATLPEPPQTQRFALLRSDAEGVSVVQSGSPVPAAMTQVALDAISYSLEGDVQLTGRARSSADQVQVYLNNRPVTALTVDDAGGWRGALPDVDSGVYTLRIDELDAEGKVTSRVETPFKREDPEVLEAAQLDPDATIKAVTVQKGATLWAIARERYGEGTLYLRVFEANKDTIRDPDLIYPGQVFNLPEN